MSNFVFKPVDKEIIKNGDVILHNGIEMTVGDKDIKKGFMGLTIFADSYSLGNKKVLKGVYNDPRTTRQKRRA